MTTHAEIPKKISSSGGGQRQRGQRQRERRQCGQELTGTSCGCTRNWVARVDADVTTFYDLVDLAGELECELPFFSTCDCPEAKGFACDAGICTWNYIRSPGPGPRPQSSRGALAKAAGELCGGA